MSDLKRLLNSTYFFALRNIFFKKCKSFLIRLINDKTNHLSEQNVCVQQFIRHLNESLETKIMFIYRINLELFNPLKPSGYYIYHQLP